MVSVNNVSVLFGGVPLYEDISFLINERDRIGLAGKNGAGKSTMLKILCGLQKPDSGEVAKPNGFTFGYLPQDMKHNLGKTVFDEAMSAFREIQEMEEREKYINEQLTTRTDYESDAYMALITELHEITERLNIAGAYSKDAEVEKTLLGLGFEREDFTRLTDEFSGGWRMRVEIAKLLLQRPNLLLLDEPTNHLDIESIQWLEDFLRDYYGAVVMVSHDKAFLDNLTNRTIEISLGKIHDYKANYSKYLVLRKERRATQESAFKNQQKYIEKTEALIDKYRAKANKASFAQSLIKKLDKLEEIEIDTDDSTAIRFRFPPAPRSGRNVVEAISARKAFGTRVIFDKVDFMIERGDRVAFVGRNGEGKSTMVKMIAGVDRGEGQLNIGSSVNIGYYAQNAAEILDENKTVFDTIDEVAVGDARRGVRNLLGSFLFGGDDIDKKVKVLSGGEKGRLAMCKLLLEPYSCLVLDEPTNHLDMRSKEVLKNALMNYDGTLIVVSHDRDFLTGLTNKVFEFKGGRVQQYIGDVNEYISSRKIQSLKDLELQQSVIRKAPAPKKEVAETGNEKEEKQLKSRLKKLEEEIAQSEAFIRDTEQKLSDASTYQEVMENKEMYARYEQTKSKVSQLMEEWEDISRRIEQ
ncbi:MAG: ABC-F family ATP-binding cassette domain-containing protein [Bacteroidia bacterium]|nr:ABC-F family ATP-binding cassette domain-containing protein [Bacteroidia bacterium]